MFLPRWVVVLLFLTSIVSTGTVMYLLLQKSSGGLRQGTAAQATVILSPSPMQIESQPIPSASSEEAVMASAKWVTREQKELNLKVDHPETWALTYENGTLLMSDPQSLSASVTIQRKDKATKSAEITSIVKDRRTVLEKDSAVKNVQQVSKRIDDAYDGILLAYERNGKETKELLFATRSYVYTFMTQPESEQMGTLFEEIVKSIDII